MPQMSSMDWFMLMFYFLFTYYTMMVMIYFLKDLFLKVNIKVKLSNYLVKWY